MSSSIRLPKSFKKLATPDMHAVGARVAGIVEGGIAEQYKSQGAADGTPWAPLRPSTLEGRRKGRGSRGSVQPLRDTGTMFQSLTSGGARGSVRKVSSIEVVVGTKIPYAVYHQFGTRRMPARKHVVVTPHARERILGLCRASFTIGRLKP